jgi:hypothetical protein
MSDEYSENDDQVERLLRTLSKGLVEIKGAKLGDDVFLSLGTSDWRGISRCRIVQFIHESVRDFLLNRDGLQIIDSNLSQLALGKSHDVLTKACIQHLHKYDKAASDVVSSCKQFIFWEYAVRSLFKHAARAEAAGIEQRYLAPTFSQDQH